MPSSTVQHRAQTLRQAKAAYRKAGPNRRFTEVENRQMDRNAELFERANRIKKKEINKQKNKEKKEQKLEKEKKARRKVGLPEVREAHISPSQPSLGAFLRVGIHQKSENQNGNPVDETDLRPSRGALKPKSGNETIGSAHVDSAFPVKLRSPLEAKCADFVINENQVAQEFSAPKSGSRTLARTVYTPKDKTPTAQVSNIPGQLDRISTNKALSPVLATEKICKEDFNIGHGFMEDHLQQLNSGEECLVAPTVQQGAEECNIMPPIHNEDSEFDDGLNDDDFQGLTQGNLCVTKGTSAFETQSAASQPNFATNILLQENFNDDSIFDECAVSSQDLLNLLCDDDFDNFISTQDLLDLVP